jgi:hypothetical protein
MDLTVLAPDFAGHRRFGRIHGERFGVNRFHERLVEAGRVFIAGDFAHVAVIAVGPYERRSGGLIAHAKMPFITLEM